MVKATGVLHILTTFLFLSETHSHCFVHRGFEVRSFFISTNAQRAPMSRNTHHSPAVASAQSSCLRIPSLVQGTRLLKFCVDIGMQLDRL
jgi:hypothetical protein